MQKSFIKTKEEVERLRENGKLIADILQRCAQKVKPGVPANAINEFALAEIERVGGKPSFFGYGPKSNPFMWAICVSVNDEVVHGIPSEDKIFRSGDIVGLDIGMVYKGMYSDTAITVPVGQVSEKANRLISVAKFALHSGIKAARGGNTIGDIGASVQQTVELEGFAIVRDLVGHGVGYAVHEDPMVPNFGTRGKGMRLVPGMILAIEPMVNEKTPGVVFDKHDGWTVRTRDGGLSAHFEHTIAVTDDGPEILTI